MKNWEALALWILTHPEEVMPDVVNEVTRQNAELDGKTNRVRELEEKVAELEYQINQLQRGI